MVGWSRFNPEKLEKNEKILLETSAAHFTRECVPVGDRDFLYTLASDEAQKPLLILLHGYAGSGVCFYTLFPSLSEHYNLVLVDLLGMGRSSRPQFPLTDPAACEEMFVESLEQFRRAKSYEQFILLGHSFGGYVAACYAHKYPSHIRSLVLLSPVGIPAKPKDYDMSRGFSSSS